ncbi:MAG: DUF167 domain-containing protein [Nanoarchaeota archaeon]|nr:DUF167 domain-containing protein [Nanoarchaeota archaeon]
MKIKIKVHANSSRDKIEKVSEEVFEVWLKKKPVEGKANLELLKTLKKYFGKKVEIVSGFKSQKKIVEVGEN